MWSRVSVLAGIVALVACVALPAAASPGDRAVSYGFLGGTQLGGGPLTDAVGASDGAIYIASGFAFGTPSLRRVLPSGMPDDSFGGSGQVDLEPNAQYVTMAADGDAVVVASLVFDQSTGGATYTIRRLRPDGTPDPSFRSPSLPPSAGLIAMRTDPSGHLVLLFGRAGGAVAARYDRTGAIDNSFGSSGQASIPDSMRQGDLSIAADGSMFVLLHDPYFHVYRLTASGALDQAFGTNGVVNIAFPGWTLQGVLATSDGKVVVDGVVRSHDDIHAAYTRLTSSGAFDRSFGYVGVSVPVLCCSVESLNRAVLSSDGSIVAAGITQPTEGRRAYVTKLTPNGVLDASFAGQGWRLTDEADPAVAIPSSVYALALPVVLPGGNTVVVARTPSTAFAFTLTGAVTIPPTAPGYWVAHAGGTVSSFGRPPLGGTSGGVVGGASTVAGDGYWLVTGSGRVSSFGAATDHGSYSGPLNQPMLGMAARPQGDGYWLAAGDGGIFSFGSAAFRGSTGNIRLNQPIVGITGTASGAGYWIVARDGGIFSFGDAIFHGSTGNIRLNQPIVGTSATPTGDGYWLVARDGGIFSFGDAQFFGSTGAIRLNQPIVAMAPTPTAKGYWLLAADGGIFGFGDATYQGSDPANGGAPSPAVAMLTR